MWLASAPRDAIERQAAASDEEPIGATASCASGLFWFDRAPVQKHFWLAGTRIDDAERARLWQKCGTLFHWAFAE